MVFSTIETKRHFVVYVIESFLVPLFIKHVPPLDSRKLWAHGHGSPEIPATIHAHQTKSLDIDSPVIPIPPIATRLEASGSHDPLPVASSGP